MRSILFRLRGRLSRRGRNPLFDADWYLRTYPDVAASGMDPYRHYRRHGAKERRDPSPFIDRDWYLRTYPDVAASGMDPIDHYLGYGARKGRNPCPSFHSACYLALNPDVQSAGINPLLHYQQQGIREGRQLCDLWHSSALDLTPVERYGGLLDEALAAATERSDVLWFGVIDWEYRIQRPQHLAIAMASAGHRVIYVQPHFDPPDGRGSFTIISSPHPGVFQVRLKVGPPVPSLYAGLDAHQERQAIGAIRECAAELVLREPIAVLDFPAWRATGIAVPEATVVMDCLDHVAGFGNVSARVVAEEAQLVAQADLVVASSQRLADTLGQTRPVTLIRNGADTSFFGTSSGPAPLRKTKPIIGYFGAIAEWFEIDWIEHAARAHPEWDFVLIGLVERCELSGVRPLGNVNLLGERPYAELPAYLQQFDAAIIPFKITELIQSTNPVKLYEYLSAGVPVVASPMPELVAIGDLVYLADGPSSFTKQVGRALAEDGEGQRAARRDWASNHDWRARGEAWVRAIDGAFPKVSVVVLCYNNWAETEACLESVLNLSQYPEDRLEVIVVDNGSTDGTAEGLDELRRRDRRLSMIRNDENLGFAGGNNTGIRQADGDVVILLNNDTFVTRGWIRRLI